MESDFPKALVCEKNGEISCSIEETNRIRAELGLAPLRLSRKQEAAKGDEEGVVRANVVESNGEISCSVEETNRIRAELGLAPLRLKKQRADRSEQSQQGDVERNEVSNRIEQARKQRKLHAVLKGKSLADGNEGESALDWISRTASAVNKRMESISNGEEGKLERKRTQRKEYSSKELEGMKVSHDVAELSSQNEVILTLKDSNIIDAETGELAGDIDELENVRLAAVEKEKDLQMKGGRKRMRMTIHEDDEEAGAAKTILSKYDQVLEDEGLAPKKQKLAKGVLSGMGEVKKLETLDGSSERGESIQHSVQTHSSLSVQDRILANLQEKKAQDSVQTRMFTHMQDYYNFEEMEQLELLSGKKSKEKKHKKQKKEKKKHKTDKKDRKYQNDVAEEEEDDNQPLVLSDSRKNKRKGRSKVEVSDEDEEGIDLSNALQKSRKSMLNELDDARNQLFSLKSMGGGSKESDDVIDVNDNLVLSSSTGFSSMIQTRNQEHLKQADRKKSSFSNPTVVAVPGSMDTPTSAERGDNDGNMETILGEEEGQVSGIAQALRFLGSRGDLRPRESGATADTIVVGRSKDAKPVQDDGEGGFILEYRDDQGRLLSTKEAYRELCYKFNGQRPGLNREHKRARQLEREQKARSDILNDQEKLNTLSVLRNNQEKTGSAHMKL